MLSALGFVEFAAGDHRAVDRALVRMRQCLEAIGTRDMVPDRSEPFHVESLLVLGEHERARSVLARLEERGRIFPRLWITATLPRARALVLAAEGDVEAALAALEKRDVDAESKLPFDLALDAARSGRLHRRIKQRRAAADALAKALEIFEQLGAARWVEQAQAELGRVGPAPGAAETDGHRAPGRRARRFGADEPRGRERGLHEPEDGRRRTSPASIASSASARGQSSALAIAQDEDGRAQT